MVGNKGNVKGKNRGTEVRYCPRPVLGTMGMCVGKGVVCPKSYTQGVGKGGSWQ